MLGYYCTIYLRLQCTSKTVPFLFLKLIGQFHFVFLCACQQGSGLLYVALCLCCILKEMREKVIVLQKLI